MRLPRLGAMLLASGSSLPVCASRSCAGRSSNGCPGWPWHDRLGFESQWPVVISYFL